MRKGVVFGVRGGLALLAIVAFLAICLPRLLAQDGLGGVGGRPLAAQPQPAYGFSPNREPEAARQMDTQGIAGPKPSASLQDQLKSESIDQLLIRLDSIKAQKADLDKQEKDTVEALKEKVSQQNQRLQKLGVNLGDATKGGGDEMPSSHAGPASLIDPQPMSPPKSVSKFSDNK